MISTLVSPWHESFKSLLRQVSNSLLICSPFIGFRPCEEVAASLGTRGVPGVSLLVVTDLSVDHMLAGSTDVAGLLRLSEAIAETEIRILPNIHAKVYVADEKCAVVTSGNLTDRGLDLNLEYGVLLSDPSLVRRIKSDVACYASVGSVVDTARLRLLSRVVEELKDIKQSLEKTAKARFRREFHAKLLEAQGEVLCARAEGLSAHAAFADTILFLLKEGPKDTRTLYSEIRNIHPDLCDDNIHLVIRGEPWSQVNWHHKVRHAQLFLKRQEEIRLSAGKWQLV